MEGAEGGRRGGSPGRTVRGLSVPSLLYGTAWKEGRTRQLVAEALEAGFRGFDTANQPKHYREEGVGDALAAALDGAGPARDELFVQTKFTHPAGQGERPPYDPAAGTAEQVRRSFRSSLRHLRVDRVESYLLHAPSQRRGLGEADREAWRAMEDLHDSGRARLLGVSNVTADQLRLISDFARVEPAFVQNRCRARRGWDASVRQVCRERGVVYQGFSLLTANRTALEAPAVREAARRHGWTVPQVIFRFALELGIVPLTGTTDPEHMSEDLAVRSHELGEEEVRRIERVAR